LVGYVPLNIVEEIFDNCKIKNNSEILQIAQNFYTLGYPVCYFCEQLLNVIINDQTITEIKKGKILVHLTKSYEQLNSGSSEMIQLINILFYINSLFT
jgi:hypothetical protein